MTLKEWLTAKGYTVTQFADIMGVTLVAVYAWLNGTRFPNKENMRLLMDLSDDEIDPRTFY